MSQVAAEYYQKQMRSVERALSDGRRYLLDDRFSAADMLLSACITWAVRYGVPVTDAVITYNQRITARPALAAVECSNTPPAGPTSA